MNLLKWGWEQKFPGSKDIVIKPKLYLKVQNITPKFNTDFPLLVPLYLFAFLSFYVWISDLQKLLTLYWTKYRAILDNVLSLLTKLSCKVIEMHSALLKTNLAIYASDISNEKYIKRHIQTDRDCTVSGRPGVYKIIFIETFKWGIAFITFIVSLQGMFIYIFILKTWGKIYFKKLAKVNLDLDIILKIWHRKKSGLEKGKYL